MTTVVDTRIVEMMFNNKQFENGVKQSSTSLEKLKKGLDLTESAKNLSNLSRQGKSFSLANIGESVGQIASKFSVFGVIGFTVLQKLTNAAINFGQKLVSGILTPMKMGFSEYETQMNAIQTVLANTQKAGTTLEDVSKALNELNIYADKTIYNFTEMTRNIGTFTAAGVDLETSTAAIKGIANLAAVSGSTSQQASTAMYQLSQALSSGTVKLMDWNSVVNAGMGGQVFQDALKETARVHGLAIDQMIDNEGSFRETLQHGWLTSDILLETLQKFTGDLSKEQLLSMGYAEDQIEAILKLGVTANDAATKVKTFTQLQETLMESLQSGWTQSWELIVGDFEEAKAFFTTISDNLGGLIGASSDARNKVLKDWKTFEGRTFLIRAISDAFEAVLSVMKPLKEAFSDVFGVKGLLGRRLADMTKHLALFVRKLILTSEGAQKLRRIFTGVFSVFGIVWDALKGLLSGFKEFIKVIPFSGEGVVDFLVKLADMVTNFREGVDISKIFRNGVLAFGGALIEIKNRVVGFGKAAIKTFENIKRVFLDWIAKVFGPIDFSNLKNSLTGFKDSFVGIFDNLDLSGFKEFVKNFKEKGIHPLEALGIETTGIFQTLVDFAAKIPGFLSNAARAIGEFLSNVLTSLSDGMGGIDFDKISKIFGGGLVGLLGIGIFRIINTIKDLIGGAGDIMESFSGLLDSVGSSLEAWQQNLKAKTLLTIAGAVAILAVSLILLSTVDAAKLGISLGIITGLFVDLMGALALMSKVGGTGSKAVIGLIGISIALLLVSGALAKISDMEPDKLGYAVAALGSVIAIMIGIMAVISRNKVDSMKAAGILIGFAIALMLMVPPIKKLGEIDSNNLVKGLLAISTILVAIGAFLRIAGGRSLNLRSAIVILGVAVALNIIAKAVSSMGKMNPDELARGVGSIIALLMALALFSKFTGTGNLVITGTGLVLLSAGLLILSIVLKKISQLKPQEIYQSLATIGAALLILVIALNAMTGALTGAAALLLAAAGLVVLAFAMEKLGKLSLEEVGIALLAIAGALTILGVAGYLLAPIVPVLLTLAGVVLLFGLAAGIAGAGMLAFGIGLGLLAASGMAAAGVVYAAVIMLLPLVPMIIQTLLDAIVQVGQGIINAQPVIVGALTALLTTLAQVIINVAPEYGQAFTVIIMTLLNAISTNAPEIVSTFLGLILTLLQTLAEKIPEFVQAGADIIIGFLQGIADNIDGIVTAGADLVVNFLDGLDREMPRLIKAASKTGKTFVTEVGNAIKDNISFAVGKAISLANNILSSLGDTIKAGVTKIKNIIKNLIKDAIDAALAALGMDSPSKVFVDIGRGVVEGFTIGLLKTASEAIRATKSLGEIAINSMQEAVSTIRDTILSDIEMDPVIKPVVDMSDIIAGGELLNSIFDKKILSLEPALISARTVSGSLGGNYIFKDVRPQQLERINQITFEQNNYSPKALSRVDIYRQTRNQLLELRRMVNQ